MTCLFFFIQHNLKAKSLKRKNLTAFQSISFILVVETKWKKIYYCLLLDTVKHPRVLSWTFTLCTYVVHTNKILVENFYSFCWEINTFLGKMHLLWISLLNSVPILLIFCLCNVYISVCTFITCCETKFQSQLMTVISNVLSLMNTTLEL